MSERRTVNVDQAAKLLGATRRTVYNWTAWGLLPLASGPWPSRYYEDDVLRIDQPRLGRPRIDRRHPSAMNAKVSREQPVQPDYDVPPRPDR